MSNIALWKLRFSEPAFLHMQNWKIVHAWIKPMSRIKTAWINTFENILSKQNNSILSRHVQTFMEFYLPFCCWNKLVLQKNTSFEFLI